MWFRKYGYMVSEVLGYGYIVMIVSHYPWPESLGHSLTDSHSDG